MEEVIYRVNLKKGVDADAAISGLEGLAEDLNIQRVDLKALKTTLVTGSTSQETYEDIFDCEIKYVTRTVNANVGRPMEVSEWVELTPAKIPKGLENYIDKIELERKAFPCKTF